MRVTGTDIDTRNAILDAAELMFARRGFAATTIKDIGKAAEVNPALLYYYYDSKETLYREVLRRVFAGLIDGGMLPSPADPHAGIRQFVAFQARTLAARPHLPMLFVRELIDHEAKQAEEQITRLAATAFERLCEMIREGQRQGAFRADVDPHFAAISTIAQVAYLFIARPAVGILLGRGRDGLSQPDIDAFAAHAADFACAALTASPEPSTASAP